MNEKDLINKIITSIKIDGYGITMTTKDGIVLNFGASDGGYSYWEIFKDDEVTK